MLASRLDAFLASHVERLAAREPFDPHHERRLFVHQHSPRDRVGLLLAALDRYRHSAPARPPSLTLQEIIGTAYRAQLDLADEEAFALLTTAAPRCDHGDDPAQPLELALRQFHNRPLPADLFGALRTFRATLERQNTGDARLVRRRLDLLLWLDINEPFHPACFTDRIRLALSDAGESGRAAWIDLFRHASVHDLPSPSPSWRHPALRLLEAIGRARFVTQTISWFSDPLPQTPAPLTTAGSTMLKNLVWYASFFDNPALDLAASRLATLAWARPRTAAKVLTAVSWLLRRRRPTVEEAPGSIRLSSRRSAPLSAA